MEHDLLLFYFYLFISCYSTGQLVVIGGVNGATGALADMASVWVYDPSSDNWTGQNVSAPQGTPSTGSDRTAVVSKYNFLEKPN